MQFIVGKFSKQYLISIMLSQSANKLLKNVFHEAYRKAQCSKAQFLILFCHCRTRFCNNIIAQLLILAFYC